jgi:hypothetical protein
MFEEKREVVLAIEAAVFAVDDLNVFGHFGVFRFPLQFPLSLMIELLIPALRFSSFLPKFIRAANNFPTSILVGFFIVTFSRSTPVRIASHKGNQSVSCGPVSFV